jgi:hypothetical protein
VTGVICPGFPVHIFANALEIAKRKDLFLYIFPTAFPSEIRRDESRNIVSTCGVIWQALTPSEGCVHTLLPRISGVLPTASGGGYVYFPLVVCLGYTYIVIVEDK